MIMVIYLKPVSFGCGPMISIAIRSIGLKVDKTTVGARMVLCMASIFSKSHNSVHIGEHHYVSVASSFRLFR